MKKIFSKVSKAIRDLCYDISCVLYKLRPVKKQQGSAMKSKKIKDLRFYCLMMAFPLLQFAIMWVGVNFNSILLSFKQYDIDMNYVWSINNFKDVINNFFHDAYLQAAFLNSAKFYAITTVITLPTSLIISYYFYKKFAGSRVLKVILFLPSVIAGVVAVTIFYYIADRGWPSLVETFTGNSEALGLLVNGDTRTITLLFFNIFYSLASGFLFYSSAMCGIDESISEAAQIDGASMVKEFWYITLPMIFPTFQTFFVAGVAGALIGDYGMYAFAKASNGNVVPTMGYYFTQGIVEKGETYYPYYAALGIVMSIITTILVFSVRRIMRNMDPYEDNELREIKKRQKQNRKGA